MSAALVAAPAVGAAPTSSANAAVGAVCRVDHGDYPNINALPHTRFDSETNAYFGGDFTASTGSSEGEGVFVVEGNATFSTDYFNLGVAGLGSRVAPAAMSRMLTTGGNVNVTSGTLDVGWGLGGNIESVGTVGPLGSITTNGGTITPASPTALDKYFEVASGYQNLSDSYAAMPAAGVVSTDADSVTFTGNGTTARQVFTIAGTQLGSQAQTKAMNFDNIPLGTIIVVNVTGSTVDLGANRFYRDGDYVDPVAPSVPLTPANTIFAQFTQSLMWNMPDATTVTLGYGDQLAGSVMIPQPTSNTTMLTSTNGRVYTGGNLLMGGSTDFSGLEFHSYPFGEAMCAVVAEGSIAITKTLTDPDAVIDPDRIYTGRYECIHPVLGPQAQGTWALTVGGEPFVTRTVPAGTVCTVSEDTLDAAVPNDGSYIWETPTITPASTTVVGSVTPSAVTVHNQVRRALGDLEMVKILDDPYDVVDLTRFYSGTFSCLLNGVDLTPAPGTWREQAGAAPVRLATGLPVGTVCTLAEDPILVPPLPGFPQYEWATPVITPATVTIAENVLARFTVTNIVVDPIADPPADPPVTLAATGTDTTGPLGVAAAMLLLGLAGLILKRRSRDRGRNR